MMIVAHCSVMLRKSNYKPATIAFDNKMRLTYYDSLQTNDHKVKVKEGHTQEGA